MRTKIKNTIKKFASDEIVNSVRKIKMFYDLNRLYSFDKRRHKQYAYNLNKDWTVNNLRSKITFHYHSIEKGLSNPDIRFGFGEKAFKELFFSMDKFIQLGFPKEDRRFQQAISVINEYVKLHEKNNYSVEWVTSKLQEYIPYYNIKFNKVGGYGVKLLNDIPNYSQLNFKDLALSRYSIRDFGEEPVNDQKINESIQVATKTPSVCNRQAYRVYRIKNKEKLKAVYKLQEGLTTNGENLQEILLVTSNREYMNNPRERNQTYIDGGMFLMSLVYGLTYNQVATCVLNADFTLEIEKEMRKLLEVSFSEDLIAFIAIGSFKNENKYAKSPRDAWEDITVVID